MRDTLDKVKQKTGMARKSGFFSGAEFSATLKVALPLGFSYMGERLIGITDSMMLGRLVPHVTLFCILRAFPNAPRQGTVRRE
ncbi:MAG: hypothetical protein LGR52_05775 [Candidatus Thiosymbion ectosymbiont of Robbea hypermnestra]|nr:hypothetical protein [Candidatus Thiosymbion ectosymbiont of Robbea hypermnestra]